MLPRSLGGPWGITCLSYWYTWSGGGETCKRWCWALTNPVLDALFERLTALPDVDIPSRNRAEKLACEGKLKHPESVSFALAESGGVIVTCEHGTTSWEVEFLPDGRFGLTLEFEGSSDGRITRVLKALGEVHWPGRRR